MSAQIPATHERQAISLFQRDIVKRALIDKWSIDKAMAEATDLGFTAQPLKTFMTDYVKTHQK